MIPLFPTNPSNSAELPNNKQHQRILGISLLLLLIMFATFIAAMVTNLIGKLGFGITDNNTIQSMLNNPIHEAQNINFLRITNISTSLISLGIPALITAIICGWSPIKIGQYNIAPSPLNFGLAILAALSLTPVVSFINQINHWIINKYFSLNWIQLFGNLNQNRQRIIEATLDMEKPLELVVCVLILAFLPALLEEFVFRGLIQRFLFNQYKKPWISLVFQGFIFSLIHFSPYEFFSIWTAGIFLGYWMYKTQSLWQTTLIHFLFNATSIVAHYITLQKFNKSGIYLNFEEIFTQPIWVACSMITLTVTLRWLIKTEIKRIKTPSSSELY